MPGSLGIFAIAIASAAYFTLLGLRFARAVAPSSLPPLGLAPVLGWAAYCAVALPVLSVFGFSAGTVRAYSVVCLAASLWGVWRRERTAVGLPPWTTGLAAAMAVLPTIALLPKKIADGVLLAPPMFDHVKIAIVDAILRTGLPVANPFFGPDGNGHLAYYYLWHFGAACVAASFHVGSWAAEAALTGFTAFASMMLMMSVALAIGAPRTGCVAVAVLSLPGSLRTLLTAWLGSEGGHRIILRESDIGGWLNQSAWVPQHLASACCVLVSILLILRLAEGGGLLVAVALGLTVAAGFESSVWAGGIAFAAAALLVGVILLREIAPDARGRFVLLGAVAVLIAAALIAPFAVLLSHRVGQGSAPIGLGPYRTLGALIPAGWRLALDVPAFWILLLPFDLPAILPLGLAGMWLTIRRPAPADRARLLKVLAAAIFGCLAVAWLLRSTIDNDDLGWRGALPAILLLATFAARGAMILISERRWRLAGAALVFAALGLPQMASMARLYVFGQMPGNPAGFAASRAMWDAVRRHSGPTDRVANNPLFLRNVTPWPVNISWGLFSDRPSCYAGKPTVIAYGNLPRPELADINARFTRVFGGSAIDGDVSVLANDYGCAIAVLASTDGAWGADPFAASADYRLLEANADWRIYAANKARK
jgi:hypothetical protein